MTTASLPAKYDIFLSYSRKDDEIAKRLDRELRARGVRTFLDQKDIDPGAIFEQNIFDELAQCRSYGVIVTHNSLGSAWVLREYEYARALHERRPIQIIPLVFEAVDLSGNLAAHSFLDFRDAHSFTTNLTKMIFPGITGKQLHVWMVNRNARPGWKVLEHRLVSTHGVSVVNATTDFVREWRQGHLLRHSLSAQTRVIAIVDLFGGWIEDEWRIGESARFLFDVRERTRGTENEVIFVLFHDPSRMEQFRPTLEQAIGEEKIARLRNYFHIDSAGSEKALQSQLDVVWVKALQEVMRIESMRPIELEP